MLRGYGIATPSTVVPTGIRLDEFARGDGARFRERTASAQSQPLLLTVSRLAIEKNIDFLLDVARALKREFDDFVFVIAGEGPDAPRLKRLTASLGLEEHVRFLGNLDRDTTLLDCYSAADVFVFASSTETQGLVLIEAMALRRADRVDRGHGHRDRAAWHAKRADQRGQRRRVRRDRSRGCCVRRPNARRCRRRARTMRRNGARPR